MKYFLTVAVITILVVLSSCTTSSQQQSVPVTTPIAAINVLTVGKNVVIEGNNFASNGHIIITIDGKILGTSTANSAGAFTAHFQVPANLMPGDHTISVTDSTITKDYTYTVASTNPESPTMQGNIHGSIVDGTTNTVPDQSFTVTLKAYLNGEISDTRTTQTGENGSFSFTGLDTSANYTYQVQVNYNKATFLGDQITFPTGQDTVSTNVSVYDTTTDLSVLSVSMAHLVIYTTGGSLTVTEVYYVNNSSTKAYNNQLTFYLPDDAMPTNMAADLSWTTVDNNNALVDSDAIPPGQTQIDYTYTLPQADSYSLTRTVPLAMQQMSVLVEGGIFNVSSPQLTKDTPLSMSGTSFDDYTSAPLQAGAELDIILTKNTAIPTTPAAIPTQTITPTATGTTKSLPIQGQPAPEFSLTSLQGQTVTLSSLKGNPVLINFFATWDPYSESEMGYFQSVYENSAFQKAGLKVYEIDVQENASTVQQFMTSHNLDMPVLLDPMAIAAETYNVKGMPTSFFINSSGIIQNVKVGAYSNVNALESDVQALIAP